MCQNVFDEIQHPQNEPRQTQVVKTHQIVRDAKTYDLYTFPDYKRYKMVYDKRVIDPSTFQTSPCGSRPRVRVPLTRVLAKPSHVTSPVSKFGLWTFVKGRLTHQSGPSTRSRLVTQCCLIKN